MALLLGIRCRQLETYCKASLCRRLSTVGPKHLSKRRFILEHEGVVSILEVMISTHSNTRIYLQY